MPYCCSTLSANVAIAKYGVTAQNQNPDVKSVARQYCRENSIPKLPLGALVPSCRTALMSAELSMYLPAILYASSLRPWSHSQCGDSGRPSRAMNKTTAIKVLEPRMSCQLRSVNSTSK